MPRIATGGVIGPLALNRQAAPPLYRQLYEDLRALILSGRLAPGSKLPSTRLLAAEHGVSRNTVLQAFDQLMGEGYVEGRRGAGSFVSRDLPHRPARTIARYICGATPARDFGAGPRHRRRAWASGTEAHAVCAGLARRGGLSGGSLGAAGGAELAPADPCGLCRRRPRRLSAAARGDRRLSRAPSAPCAAAPTRC